MMSTPLKIFIKKKKENVFLLKKHFVDENEKIKIDNPLAIYRELLDALVYTA